MRIRRRLTLTPEDRALIIGVRHGKMSRPQMEKSLSELARLVVTAGGKVVLSAHQEVKRPDPATFLGSGKVDEIGALAKDLDVDFIAVDCELTPVQNRNIEKRVGKFVLDRTAIILDIFALRARSKEGKLQVELAQLEYLAPRLVGRGQSFSQQVGRIGTRGPGETALEYDRRRIRDRIAFLRKNIERVSAHRQIHRTRRESVPIPLISLVGYTNAGKSTLMNSLTQAGVFVEDKLFATLDPTVRRLRLPSGREVLLADTVGFIRRLPHELVESFKSTFEEMAHADLLIHVIDGSDDEAAVQASVVEDVLSSLDLGAKPRIDVINKCDLKEIHFRGNKNSVLISAIKNMGTETLLSKIDGILNKDFRFASLLLPHERGDILSTIYKLGRVHGVKYVSEGIKVDCELYEKFYRRYKKYVV